MQFWEWSPCFFLPPQLHFVVYVCINDGKRKGPRVGPCNHCRANKASFKHCESSPGLTQISIKFHMLSVVFNALVLIWGKSGTNLEWTGHSPPVVFTDCGFKIWLTFEDWRTPTEIRPVVGNLLKCVRLHEPKLSIEPQTEQPCICCVWLRHASTTCKKCVLAESIFLSFAYKCTDVGLLSPNPRSSFWPPANLSSLDVNSICTLWESKAPHQHINTYIVSFLGLPHACLWISARPQRSHQWWS